MRTVTLPLLRPGIIAAWLLVFIASVRELGVSIFLVGPNAKVIAPSIVSACAQLVERAVGGAGADPDRCRVHRADRAVPRATRRLSEELHVSEARIEIADLVVRYGDVAGRERRQLHGRAAASM